MQPDGSPSRREFDRLEARVDLLYDKGTPHGRVLESELKNLRKDLQELERTVDRRLSNMTKVGVGILTALLGGLVSLLTALGTGALGG